MMFANSMFLWGLALASVPIIIYLLNKRRFKRVTWAAMEFLLAAMKKNRRRLRIENLLLLLIRTGIVVLFVMAIARPLLESDSIFSALARAKKNAVFVIDNSYSMGYKTGPSRALDRAKKQARWWVEQLQSGDRVAILKLNSQPEPLYETPMTIGSKKDVNAVLADINEITLSHKTTNVPATLDKVVDMLDKFESGAGEPKEEKVIYVITDCQFSGWAQQGEVRSKHLKKLSRAFARHKTQLHVIDVGEPEAPNFAITDLRCDHALVGTGIPVSFEVTLTNFSKRTFSDVVVELTVDDLPQEKMTVVLEPGAPHRVNFPYQFKDWGYHHVHVSAKADPLDVDNEAYLAIDVREKVTVLVVDGRPSPNEWESETDFIRAFFNAGVSEEQMKKIMPFEADVRTHRQFDTQIADSPLMELRKYDVVLLANLSDLNVQAAQALTSYIEEGGSVLMFLGDMVIPERYNLVLYGNGDGPLPVRLNDVAGDPDHMAHSEINIETYDHPITRFFKHWQLALRRPMTFQYYDCEVPEGAKDTVVIATYSDDKKTPAIVERRFGRGTMILITTSASSHDWNNWNKYPFFSILLAETVSYLSQSSMTRTNYLVGETYQRLLTTHEWASDVYIMPPTGESIKKNLKKITGGEGEESSGDESATVFLLSHKETDVAGIYRIVFAPQEHVSSRLQRTEGFAVNVDTVLESDMTKLVQIELQEAMPALEPRPVIKHYSEIRRETGSKADKPGGREFWKYFIAAVLVLLTCESLLAQRFGKHER